MRARRRQPAHQGFAQTVAGDRFGQVIVHPGGQRRAAVVAQGVGGERHDRHPLAAAGAFELADFLGRLDPVHLRHLDVHQHQIEGPVLERGDSLVAVVGDGDAAAALAEQRAGDFGVDRVIFRHQHARVGLERRHAVPPGRRRDARLAAQRGTQIGREHRLGDAQAGAGLTRVLFLAERVHARQGHNPRPVVLVPQHQRVAAFARHHAVDQQGVEAVSGGQRGLQRGLAVEGFDAATEGRELRHQGFAQGTLGGHHAHPLRHSVGRRRGAPQLGTNGEEEARALAGRAGEIEFPAQQFNQLARDHQPETGAAVAPGHRAVGLREGLEQARLHLGRNTDAAVGDPPRQHYRLAFDGGVELDPDKAAGGEFDGVRNQVVEHLAEAVTVGKNAVGHAGRDQQHQIHALGLGALGKQQGDVLDRLAGREVERVELQFAGLDLGHVEHVVDEVEQRLGRPVQGVDHALLAFVHGGAAQQLDHAHHAIHRGADFVAHVGQEQALGAVGGLRLVAREVGLFLGQRELLGAVGDFEFEAVAVRSERRVARLDLGQHAVDAVDELAHLVARPGRGAQVVAAVVAHVADHCRELQDGADDGVLGAAHEHGGGQPADKQPAQRKQHPLGKLADHVGERDFEHQHAKLFAIVADRPGAQIARKGPGALERIARGGQFDAAVRLGGQRGRIGGEHLAVGAQQDRGADLFDKAQRAEQAFGAAGVLEAHRRGAVFNHQFGVDVGAPLDAGNFLTHLADPDGDKADHQRHGDAGQHDAAQLVAERAVAIGSHVSAPAGR